MYDPWDGIERAQSPTRNDWYATGSQGAVYSQMQYSFIWTISTKKNIYKLDDLLGADLFSKTCDDDKFTAIKDRIIADLQSNIIYKRESIGGDYMAWVRREVMRNPDDILNIVMHPIDRLYKRGEDEEDEEDEEW